MYDEVDAGDGPGKGVMMPTEYPATAEESVDVITDALLTASRLLVAISAHSIAQVDENITIPQFRTLVILSNHGPINLATLATCWVCNRRPPAAWSTGWSAPN
ncbi:MarR family transcriptional regulator [Mycobacterium tuberculosis]|nr:MarR family transcriptional regulator [Mycobacterium tuberculosis]